MISVVMFGCLLVGDVLSTSVTKLNPCTKLDATACRLVSYYTDYQKMKCLIAEQIKVLTNGMFLCEKPNKNCWYHDCQMKLTDLAFERAVRPQCKCIEESRSYCKNAIDIGKETCMKFERYETEQLATCRRSQDLLMNTFMTGCGSQTHCWFPCQSERYNLESGKVSNECKCNNAQSLHMKWNAVLAALLSFVVLYLL